MRTKILCIICLLLSSCEEEGVLLPSPDIKENPKTEIPIIDNKNIVEIHPINFDEDTLTFLALGDSYTIGSGVEASDRWPNQFAKSLGNRNIIVSKPQIIAMSGWTTANLLQRLANSNLDQSYDMVSLLIGVNNQYQGVLFSTFKKEFIELLNFSMGKAKSRSSVFVLSIPDYGVTPFGGGQEYITEEINMYNQWIYDVCAANKIKFYNITELSRLAENDLSLLAADQLHPSNSMYGSWVETIIKDLPKVLIQ